MSIGSKMKFGTGNQPIFASIAETRMPPREPISSG